MHNIFNVHILYTIKKDLDILYNENTFSSAFCNLPKQLHFVLHRFSQYTILNKYIINIHKTFVY